MILQRSTLTAQPQSWAQPDWNNPLTRGLITLALPLGNTMWCAVTRQLYTVTSTPPTVGTSASGMGLRAVNSTNSFAHLPLTSFDLGDATIAVRQLCVTNVGSARPAGFSRSSSINPAFRVDQNPSSPFRPRFGLSNNSGTNLGTITSGAADPARFSATQAFTMVTAMDSAEIRAISQGFVYTPAARTAGTTTTDRFSVGGQSSSTDRLGFEGFVFVGAAWGRALSLAEMAAVDANIWQLFAQPRGRSLIAFGAHTGGTTTTIAASVGLAAASGLAASVGAATNVSAGVGSAAASGLAASVATATTVSAGVASAAASGLAASIGLTTTVAAGVGSAAASGLAANAATATAVSAGVGSAAASGLQASVVTASVIAAGVASAAATGQAATITLGTGVTVSAEVGAAAASGPQAGVITATVIAAGAGAATASGLGAQIVVATRIAAGTGAAAASGLGAVVTSSEGLTVSAGVASATAAGLAAQISITVPFITGNPDAIRMPARARIARILSSRTA